MIKNKVLVYLQDETLRDQLSVVLEGLYDLKVTTVVGLEGVLRSLDKNQYVANIFSRDNKGSSELGSFFDNLSRFGHSLEYSAEKGLKKFFEDCDQGLNAHKFSHELYCPISLSRLDVLAKHKGLHPELFVKLKSGRFVKVHPGEERIEKERVEEFRERGVNAFYLKREDFNSFVLANFSELSEFLTTAQSGPVEELEESALVVHQKLMQAIRDSLMVELKIPEHVLNESSQFLDILIANGPLKAPWFNRLESIAEGTNYIERLGVLTAHFGCWILSHSAYNEKKWYEKFVSASLIMDLSLQDEKMARVRVVHEGSTTVGVLQAMTIKEHPQRSLELAESLMYVHQDVINLVELHHERFDGTGFPRKRFVSQLPSVSRLFILAQMCADFWIESEEREDFRAKLSELADNQALRSLHEVLKNMIKSLS